MAYETKLPDNIENTLKKAADEILRGNKESIFTVESNDEPEESYFTQYDKKEISEFLNFNVLGEEGDDMEPFEQLAANMIDLTGDRKVLKEITENGVGQIVPEDSIVLIHYIAHFENIIEPFDVTYLHGNRPQRFSLGEGELLPGLEIAIKSMRKGEHARFLIHPDLAYRELGCPPRIPGNATIHFEVDLVNYYSKESSFSFDEDFRDPNRYQKILNKVLKFHKEGNELFKSKNIDKAVVKYNRGKELLHIITTNSDSEETEVMKFLCKLYTNLCICYLKLCAFSKVCIMAKEARQYADRFAKHNAKLFYNWGKALRFLKNFTEAKNMLQRAQKICPNDIKIHEELEKLENDREFSKNIVSFSSDEKFKKTGDDLENRMPLEFWDVFNKHFEEFENGVDDIFTVSYLTHPYDIELVKRKAELLDYQFNIVDNEYDNSDYIIIQK
ncbi:inactive peptidyl-prolyl cis-trans isomerase FKBP6 [Daktulosphaira vitifoliae]|uniref:inactive peptidyl-prolyl cis-trans isomerase FKBP6 n=1 Tax=Daktulosphaira vitifoliae TaxID=58002 RepID=UPI0021AA17A6|nr:inactive peptidyl-prolyl cis-trans isomerase FKBP6 [Daktulosphaira vitifoliae]XP_050542611.1 inactive peptidyl-prolyl cis-trans isomerase FKBP6 [Daktulosphaira vitifoliae]XP_050542620.1 inactive peptidyl-prolyl cis-trans isomerase FKBP6 [Daktulosphaira vitifoliae]